MMVIFVLVDSAKNLTDYNYISLINLFHAVSGSLVPRKTQHLLSDLCWRRGGRVGVGS